MNENEMKDLIQKLDKELKEKDKIIQILKESIKIKEISESGDEIYKVLSMPDDEFNKRMNEIVQNLQKYFVNLEETRLYYAMRKTTKIEDRIKSLKEIVDKRCKELKVKEIEIPIELLEKYLCYEGDKVELWIPLQIQQACKKLGLKVRKSKGYTNIKLSVEK